MYIFPIVVIRGCRPCVHHNWSPHVIISDLSASITKIDFIQFTLDPPPIPRPEATIGERSHIAGLDFATWNVNVSWLARPLKKRPGCIWFVTLWVCGPASTIWAIWNQKNTDGSNFLDAHQNLQGRISLGKTTCSDASSSPSWTHYQHNSDRIKFKRSYLLQRWYRKLYGQLRTLWYPQDKVGRRDGWREYIHESWKGILLYTFGSGYGHHEMMASYLNTNVVFTKLRLKISVKTVADTLYCQCQLLLQRWKWYHMAWGVHSQNVIRCYDQ